MLTIIENPDFNANILSNRSNVILTMVLVDNNTNELIFKTEFRGVLSDFTKKYGDLIPSNTNVEVFLDLTVNVEGTKYRFVTVSSENELASQFKKLTINDYPYQYELRSNELDILLIEESIMKGIVSETWETYTLPYEEIQSKINQLNALASLNTQKLNNYKLIASDLVIRGTNIKDDESNLIKKGSFIESMNFIYKIMSTYDILSEKVTLSTTEFKKYSAIKTIYRLGNIYYNLVTGEDLPVEDSPRKNI
jgi:hypothetical protein